MKKAFSFICVGLMALSCTGERAGDLVSQDFAFADQQLRYALTETENVRISLGKTPEELPSPRNIQSDGSLRLVRARDWCSGFFPGELWYMYEYTKDDFWKKKAEFQTELLEPLKSSVVLMIWVLCSIVVMATDTVWSNRININRYCWRGQTLWPLVLTRWSVVFVPGIIMVTNGNIRLL